MIGPIRPKSYFDKLNSFKNKLNILHKIKCDCDKEYDLEININHLEIRCDHCSTFLSFILSFSENIYHLTCIDTHFKINECYKQLIDEARILLFLLTSIKNSVIDHQILINMNEFTNVIRNIEFDCNILKFNGIIELNDNKIMKCDPIIYKYLYIITCFKYFGIPLDIVKLIIDNFELVSTNKYSLPSLIDFVSNKNFNVTLHSFTCINSGCVLYSEEIIKYSWCSINETNKKELTNSFFCKNCNHTLSKYDKRYSYKYWRKHTHLCCDFNTIIPTKYACYECEENYEKYENAHNYDNYDNDW
jgi:hypothetical protein